MEELHPQMVKQARASGQLNLSNRGLVAVPARVWTIGELDAEERRKVRVCMMGDCQVGKTSLVSQFITSEHIHTFDSSLGELEGLK